MNEDTQIGALSGKVDQFQKDLLVHQIADEKSPLRYGEVNRRARNRNAGRHRPPGRALEKPRIHIAGVEDIKTAIHGFDSIADGFLREHKTV